MKVDITSTGLYLPDADLWLDPPAKKATAFVSHAHTDHACARHDHMVCTRPTAEAVRIRLGELRSTELEFDKPFELECCRITLHPAGHVLGSAQLLVEQSGHRLVYTGDFKLQGSLTCQPARILEADTLVIEATYGLPVFRFPPTEQSRREIIRFAQTALATNKTPVFLGYCFGKGPEITKILDQAGIPTMLHESVYEMLEVYVGAGVGFVHPIRFDPAKCDSHAVIIPPHARRERLLQNVPEPVVACVSGFAGLDRTFDRMNVDACICLSDHADWQDLLRYVQTSAPERVLVTHGHCDALAGYLRQEGFDAQAVHFRDLGGRT